MSMTFTPGGAMTAIDARMINAAGQAQTEDEFTVDVVPLKSS